MSLAADVLIREANSLPYAERAKLVDTLLTTLDPIVEDDCDVAWFAEIASREQSIVNGTARNFSWDDVKRQAHERIRE